MSLENLNVVTADGSSASVGSMPPAVGMSTDQGDIASIDSEGIITIGSSPASCRFYGHQLYILEPVATGYGWPTGSGCVTFGHSGEADTLAQASPNNQELTLIYPSGGHDTFNFTPSMFSH